MGDDTDPISGDPLDWFAQRLRDLRTAAGGPSLRDLVGLTKAIGRPYRLSTIQAKLAGTSRPGLGIRRGVRPRLRSGEGPARRRGGRC